MLTDGADLPVGAADLPVGAAERLSAAGIEVDPRKVASLAGPGSELESVAFSDGTERALSSLLVPVTLSRRSDLPDRLGAARAPATPMTSDAVGVGARMNAGVPGLFAAGDLIPVAPSVASAIATGHLAAAMVVQSLTAY